MKISIRCGVLAQRDGPHLQELGEVEAAPRSILFSLRVPTPMPERLYRNSRGWVLTQALDRFEMDPAELREAGPENGFEVWCPRHGYLVLSAQTLQSAVRKGRKAVLAHNP